MITCRNVQQLQNAFLDGDLSPSLTAEVHAHLLQCPECQHQVETLRAAGDVIARDQSEPALAGGFAQRVIAQLPRVAEQPVAVLPRRSGSWRVRQWASRAALPAVAALVLLAVWALPAPEEVNTQPTLVAGDSVAVDAAGVTGMVDPALSAVADTQRAARSLNQMIELGVGRARDGLSSQRPRAGNKSAADQAEFSVLDLLMQPINEMMAPMNPEPESDDIVRF